MSLKTAIRIHTVLACLLMLFSIGLASEAIKLIFR